MWENWQYQDLQKFTCSCIRILVFIYCFCWITKLAELILSWIRFPVSMFNLWNVPSVMPCGTLTHDKNNREKIHAGCFNGRICYLQISEFLSYKIYFSIRICDHWQGLFLIITAQKMKLSIKYFYSKCDQIRSFLRGDDI